MISKKIIIIENQNLTKHLVDRLDFKNSYHGFYIECWNLSPIINYRMFMKYKYANIKSKNKFINIFSIAQLFKIISKIEKNFFYYSNNCGGNFTATIIDIILFFKGGKKILLLPSEHKLNISYHNRIKAIFNFSIVYFFKKVSIFIFSQLIKKFVKLISPRPSIIFAGNNFIYKKLKKKKMNIFKSISPEYEKFLNTKIKKDKKYIVYIDQDFFRSYDEVINISQPMILESQAREYEKNLFKTINNIVNSKLFKKYPLIIAAHPRRKKKFFFIKQKVFYNKTFELVSKAKIVLAHTSLAIKYAILLNKPIILLESKKYFDSENLAEIKFLKKKLKLLTIDISDNNLSIISKIKSISFDKKKYIKFRNEFIIFPKYQNKNRWKDVVEIIKKLN